MLGGQLCLDAHVVSVYVETFKPSPFKNNQQLTLAYSAPGNTSTIEYQEVQIVPFPPPRYADLFFAAVTSFHQRFDQAAFEKLMGLGGGELKALYEACLPWLEGQGEEKEWPIIEQA